MNIKARLRSAFNFLVSGLALLLLLGVGLLLLVAGFNGGSDNRLMAADSKLAFGEERIAHIPREFIRRSPEFKHAWETFKACNGKPCDISFILQTRNRAIEQNWPMIFDRLMIFGDWGEAEESLMARDEFFENVQEIGAKKLRDDCFPKITFEHEASGGNFYHFTGFVC